VQLIPGYKGLIDLARRSGEVSNIIAKEVCKGDEFAVDFSQDVPFTHKPKLSGERGEVTHFWARASFKDGGFHWDYMTVDEVRAIRDGSSGWKIALKYAKRDANGNVIEVNSPWHNNFIEMGKKTVIRRIAKFLPMSVQRAAMTEELMDRGVKFSTDETGEIIIEQNEGVVIEGEAADQPTKTESVKDRLRKKAGTATDEVATQNLEASTASFEGVEL
jgi:recombination protein RecT